jgi:sulfite reductase (ferredoxin)
VPSKRIPETVDRITGRYLAERRDAESFQSFVARIGKAECKRMLEDLMEIPSHDADPSLYTDWADAREFTTGDIGTGECAGEVVAPVDFQLTACEREVFEAQLHLERGDAEQAAKLAYESMLHGAAALLNWRMVAIPDGAESVVSQFRSHFYDSQLFFDPFVGGNFANYFFRAHEEACKPKTHESAHRLVGEAQLFVDACHSCYGRLSAQAAAAAA